MAQQFYKIVDKNGYEMPEHYSGRNRTYEEAKKMVDNLNKNGEHRPYTMIETQQTAVEFLFEEFFKVKWDDMPNRPIIFEQAKQMEKEQIINAHTNGQAEFDTGAFRQKVIDNSEQYYNETYNK